MVAIEHRRCHRRDAQLLSRRRFTRTPLPEGLNPAHYFTCLGKNSRASTACLGPSWAISRQIRSARLRRKPPGRRAGVVRGSQLSRCGDDRSAAPSRLAEEEGPVFPFCQLVRLSGARSGAWRSHEDDRRFGCASTLLATLPNTHRPIAVRPWVDITIRPRLCFSANARMVSAAFRCRRQR